MAVLVDQPFDQFNDLNTFPRPLPEKFQVIDDDYAYASYYTSPINHDYGWILGMFSPTSVRMAKIDLKAMKTLADQTEAK